MKSHWHTIRRLIWQLLLLLAMYSFCRILFIAVNKHAFHIGSTRKFLYLMVGGLRFDISTIVYTNSLFILLSLIPFPVTQYKWYQQILKWLFIITNSLCLLVNCIDIVSFQFIQKRIQFEVVKFINGEEGGKELILHVPQFLKMYWWLLLVYVAGSWLLAKAYNRTIRNQQKTVYSIWHYVLGSVTMALILGFSVLGFRGGFQGENLNIIHASQMTEVENIPVLLNAPFCLIKTYRNKGLEPRQYFADNEISSCFTGVHIPAYNRSFQKQNIMVIVLESLSKKYLGLFNKEAKTPFLDSLFGKGLLFSNAYANAKVSTQGIPAILSSIPSWQDDFFVTSNYSTNRITSLANLLKPHGYTSVFYHGGRNGSMSFDTYCGLAGFDKYVGKDQYPSPADFDGNWGIWDEPFLQFTADEIGRLPQPFVAAVLTLSTHTPYNIPEKYRTLFPQKDDPMLHCIQYLDLSLRNFFEQIKKEPWFNNTLFIFSADHTAHGLFEATTSPIDFYAIPIVFYKPDNSLKGVSSKTANQIDILPTALHLLNFPGKYFALGNNLLDNSCPDFSINFKAGIYQYFDSLHCYQFNGRRPVGLFYFQTDRECHINRLSDTLQPEIKRIDSNLKKKIQSFTSSMINNRMYIE